MALTGHPAGTTFPVDHCGGWLNEVPGSESGDRSARARVPDRHRRRDQRDPRAGRARLRVVAAQPEGRAGRHPAPGGPAVRRPGRRAGRDHHPGDGQDDRRGPGRAGVHRRHLPVLRRPRAGAAQGRAAGLEHAGHGLGPEVLDRRAAGHHAVELPVLPGRPVRRPEPDDREHHRSEACTAVPGVGPGDGADLPRRGAARGRLHQHLRHQRAGGDDDRRPAHRRACR